MRRVILATSMLLLGLVLLALLPLRLARGADGPAPLRAEVLRPGAEAGPTRVGVGVWLADVSKTDSAAQTFSASVFITLD